MFSIVFMQYEQFLEASCGLANAWDAPPSPAIRLLGYSFLDEATCLTAYQMMRVFVERLTRRYISSLGQDADSELVAAYPMFAYTLFNDNRSMVICSSNEEGYGVVRQVLGKPAYQIATEELKKETVGIGLRSWRYGY